MMLLSVLFALLAISTAASAQTTQAKCPKDTRCLSFTGFDNFRTDVQISNGAEEVLAKYNIILANNGTKLIYITSTCQNDTSKCGSVDLTGRHPNKYVSPDDLNKTVKLTSFGSDTVKVWYEEYDGDGGEYSIVKGKSNMPKVRKAARE